VLPKPEMDGNLSGRVLKFWIKPEENVLVFLGATKQEQSICPHRALAVTLHRDVEGSV